jgi:hypothetical protein
MISEYLSYVIVCVCGAAVWTPVAALAAAAPALALGNSNAPSMAKSAKTARPVLVGLDIVGLPPGARAG